MLQRSAITALAVVLISMVASGPALADVPGRVTSGADKGALQCSDAATKKKAKAWICLGSTIITEGVSIDPERARGPLAPGVSGGGLTRQHNLNADGVDTEGCCRRLRLLVRVHRRLFTPELIVHQRDEGQHLLRLRKFDRWKLRCHPANKSEWSTGAVETQFDLGRRTAPLLRVRQSQLLRRDCLRSGQQLRSQSRGLWRVYRARRCVQVEQRNNLRQSTQQLERVLHHRQCTFPSDRLQHAHVRLSVRVSSIQLLRERQLLLPVDSVNAWGVHLRRTPTLSFGVAVPHQEWADFDARIEPPAPGYAETAPSEGGSYTQVGDSGWHMLLCWLAGPDRVGRVKDDIPAHTTRTTILDRSRGEQLVLTEPRSQADQAIIEDSINDYLAAAGVPARPAGFVWFLRTPPGRELGSLVAAVFALEKAYAELRPQDTAACMGAAISEFYSGS